MQDDRAIQVDLSSDEELEEQNMAVQMTKEQFTELLNSKTTTNGGQKAATKPPRYTGKGIPTLKTWESDARAICQTN